MGRDDLFWNFPVYLRVAVILIDFEVGLIISIVGIFLVNWNSSSKNDKRMINTL